MPARTLNDFLAVFFYGSNEAKLEVKMAITRQSHLREGTQRHGSRRKGRIEEIVTGGEEDKGQAITVHYKAAPQRKEKSTFGWFEEFTMEWSETLIFKK
jgi:hypothetical protein